MLVNPVATTNDSDPASVGDAENNTPEPGGADTTTSTGPGGATSNRTCALDLQIHSHPERQPIRRPRRWCDDPPLADQRVGGLDVGVLADHRVLDATRPTPPSAERRSCQRCPGGEVDRAAQRLTGGDEHAGRHGGGRLIERQFQRHPA